MALALGAAQMLRQVGEPALREKQQLPMLAPLTDGNSALLLAMRSSSVRCVWACSA
jgi:hypothetical protein